MDIVRQSLATLWAHKLRSFLTMFGIAWGVGSLLLLVGLGEGFRSGQEKNLANLGQDIMFTFSGRIPAVEGSTQSGQTYHFTYDDYLAIRDQSKFIRAISPVLNREDIRAVSDYGSTNGQVFGVAPAYNQIRNVPVNPGRWFNDEDNNEHRRVAVVGWELLKNTFPGRPAVRAIRNSLAFHHGFDPKDERAVFVFDAVKDLADLTVITVGIKVLLGFIGMLTLGIGGVGLMNIMLVSVTQRTREIGVEKALGARRWQILFQFLAEALVITFIGGLVGVVLAYLISWSVGSLTLWSAFIDDASEGDIHLIIDTTILWEL
jgi:ABC-type antimicrobial peptide transport system permease subunit